MATTKHSRRLESADFKTPITPSELSNFLLGFERMPPNATLKPILGDIGTQRDPHEILRGIIVEWDD